MPSPPDTPSLRQLQEAMAAQILAPHDAGRLQDWLRVPAGADLAVRLRVYSDGYPIRIHEALAESFPALARLLGAAAFAELAQRYTAATALGSYNLNDAGAPLADFLRRDPLAIDRPFLVDLAALEWKVARAFHAADGDGPDPRSLGWSLDDWAGAVLQFQPSVALCTSDWPLLELWSGEVHAPQPLSDTEHLVVRRAGLVVRCEVVSAAEALALRLLLDGVALGRCVERLDAAGHEPAAVMAWFSRWSAAGLIRGARRGA